VNVFLLNFICSFRQPIFITMRNSITYYSAPNVSTNYCLLSFWVSRRVGLTTLPPSVSRMSEDVGASTSRNPKGLHGLYGDNFTFKFLGQLIITLRGVVKGLHPYCLHAQSCIHTSTWQNIQ
jgi:hypothetical protein